MVYGTYNYSCWGTYNWGGHIVCLFTKRYFMSLLSVPLIPGTAVYIWSSWLAVVVTDEAWS